MTSFGDLTCRRLTAEEIRDDSTLDHRETESQNGGDPVFFLELPKEVLATSSRPEKCLGAITTGGGETDAVFM